MLLEGQVTSKVEGKGFYIFCPATDTQYDQITSTHKPQVLVEFEDGRSLTSKQRRKVYVLINCIAEWAGYTPLECMKEMLKLDFAEQGHKLGDGMFSLSNADRTTTRLFITFLIEFCLVNGVPCGEPFWKLAEDVPKYVYACLMNKRCAVCGQKAELHHYDAVGMGRNRKEICHIGMRALPLCRIHHTEIHTSTPKREFCEKYILEPVKIDEAIARKHKLKR